MEETDLKIFKVQQFHQEEQQGIQPKHPQYPDSEKYDPVDFQHRHPYYKKQYALDV